MRKAAERETSSGQDNPYKRARIMQLHGGHWQKLTPRAKQQYEQQALLERAASQHCALSAC